MTHPALPARMARLSLPERKELPGGSLRAAEADLAESVPHGAPDLVDLTYADTKRFPPPEWTIDTFVDAATGTGMTYTPYRGDGGIREAVAANVSSLLGMDVDPTSEVILTPGSQAALYHAMAAIVEQGDDVVVFDPDYLTSERMLRYFGATVHVVPQHWDAEEPGPDLDVLERILVGHRPSLVVFSNPNNPTGAVHSGAVLDELARLVLEHSDAYVLVDQLYCRLRYDDGEFTHLATLPGMRERTITLLGPSKTESLSGYRLGLAVAPAAIVDRMEDLLSVTALRAPAYAQHLLARWVADDEVYVKERISEYQQLRDTAVRRLQASEVIEVTPALGTAYLFPRWVGLAPSDQEVLRHLQSRARVVINPGYQFGRGGAGHVRICFAQAEEVLDDVLERVVAALEELA